MESEKWNLPGIAGLSGYAVTPAYGENLDLSHLFLDGFQMPGLFPNSTNGFILSWNCHPIVWTDSGKSSVPNVTITAK